MKYIEKQFGTNGTTYIREDRLEELAKVDVIVFDCDGVLIDVRDSYSRAVARTTCILVEAFTGTSLPESMFDDALNFAYKKTGGFNNDWTHTYAYFMRIMAELTPTQIQTINKVAEESQKINSLAERLEYIRINRPEIIINQDGLFEKLMGFVELLTIDGVESVDAQTLPKLGDSIKKAVNFRAPVGESMLSTLFEEILGGTQLFQETFKAEAQFSNASVGLIENEKLVATENTFAKLTEVIGGSRFGIASGSLANTARHVLGDLLNWFPEGAQIWHDQVVEAIQETGVSDLHKPNPYPLRTSANYFEPFEKVLYVGDTVADSLMASRARENDPRFLFMGVYGNVAANKAARDVFLEAGSDIVAPDVNQLYQILKMIPAKFKDILTDCDNTQ